MAATGQRQLRWRIALFAILGLALALRLGLAAYLRPVPISDFKSYWKIAVDLAHGNGYVTEEGPSAYRPIGYPLLLSLVVRFFGEDWWYGIVAQVLTSTGVVAATNWLAARLFGPTAGLAAAALTAVMPDHLLWSTVLGTEIPCMLWTLLGVALWVPPRDAAGFLPPFGTLLASGAFLGLAALTRPVLLPAAGLFLLYAVLWARPGWRSPAAWRRVAGGTAAVALGMALVVAPWTVRNYLALGAFVPVSTNGGVNLRQGNNPYATGAFFWSGDPAVNPLLRVRDEVERDRLGRRLALGLVAWVVREMAGPAGELARTSVPALFLLYMLALHFVFPAWDRFRFPFTPFMLVLSGLALVASARAVPALLGRVLPGRLLPGRGPLGRGPGEGPSRGPESGRNGRRPTSSGY